jgi:hypothetical protein
MFGIVPSPRTLGDPFGKLTADLAKGVRAAHSELLADQLSVIMMGVYACAVAWCAGGWATEGAATTIIAKAAPRISRPAVPVSHVALARSLLITVVILFTPFPDYCCPLHLSR